MKKSKKLKLYIFLLILDIAVLSVFYLDDKYGVVKKAALWVQENVVSVVKNNSNNNSSGNNQSGVTPVDNPVDPIDDPNKPHNPVNDERYVYEIKYQQTMSFMVGTTENEISSQLASSTKVKDDYGQMVFSPGKWSINDFDQNKPGKYVAVFTPTISISDKNGVLNDITAIIEIIGHTISIDVSNKTYDGDPISCGITSSAESYSIAYYQGETLLTDPPINSGNYKVVVSIGEEEILESAEKEFTIYKASGTPINIVVNDKNYNEMFVQAIVTTEAEDYVLEFYSVGEEEVLLEDAPINAGSYKAVAFIPETENFKESKASCNFIISKADVYEIDVDVQSKTYDGKVPTITINANEDYVLQFYQLGLTTTLLEEAPINVGTYKAVARIEGTENYNEAISECSFAISKADCSEISVSVTNKVFDGKPADIEVTTSEDYLLEYYSIGKTNVRLEEAPIDAGKYRVVAVVLETENYNGTSDSKEYVIDYAIPTLDITNTSKVYDGYAIEVNVESPLAYTMEWSKGKNRLLSAPRDAGEYTLIVKTVDDKNYYPKSETLTVIISKADCSSISVNVENKVYDGNPVEVSVTSGEKYVLKYYQADTLLNKSPVDAGSYKVVAVVEETENYFGTSAEKEFSITAATPIITISNTSKIYDGEPIEISVESPVECSIEWFEEDNKLLSAPINAGTYRVDVKTIESDNYTYKLESVIVTISKATTTVAVTVENKVFDGTPVSALVTGIGDYIVEYYLDENKLEAAPVDAGSYKAIVILAESDNYLEAQNECEFVISKAPCSNVQLSINNKIYDGEVAPLEVTTTELYTIEYYSVGKTDELLPAAPVNAGKYKVVAVVAETLNYLGISVSKEFTISSATPTITITNTSKVYDGEPIEITVETLAEYSIEWFKGKTKLSNTPVDAGTYTAKVKTAETKNFNENSETVDVTISKANCSSISISVEDKVYDGSPISITVSTEDEYTLKYYLVVTDELLPVAPTNAGDYKVVAVIEENDNYYGNSDTKEFTIRQANPVITITNTTKVYDGEPVMVSIKSPVNYTVEWYSEDNKLENAPTSAGNYTVKVKVSETDNYSAGLESAAVTISKANCSSISVGVNDKIYDGNAIDVAVTTTEEYVIEYYLIGDPDELLENVPVNVGTYKVVAKVLETENYFGAMDSKEFTISKATPTISISNTSKVYNNKAISITITSSLEGYTVKWYQDEDKLADAPKNAGSYRVEVSIAESENYNAVLETADVTISKATKTAVVTYIGEQLFHDSAKPTADKFNVECALAGNLVVTVDDIVIGNINVHYEYTPTNENYNVISGDLTLSVKQNPYPITVTFNGNGGTLVSGSEVQILTCKEDVVVAPVYEFEQFDFIGFSEDINNITENCEIYALWKYTPYYYFEYSVDSYFKNDGNNKFSKLVDYDVDTIDGILNKITYQSDYTTLKLYSNIELTYEVSTISLVHGVNTFYAVIDAGTHGSLVLTFTITRTRIHTIHYVIDGPITIDDIVVVEGDTLAYVLDMFEDGYSYDSSYDLESPVTENLTVTIHYYLTSYTITYHDVPAGYTLKTTFTKEDTYHFIDVEKVGYTFDGWFLDSEYHTAITDLELGTMGSFDVYAKFTKDIYTIFYDYNSGVIDGTNPTTYSYGDTLTLVNPVLVGYVFKEYRIYTSNVDYVIYADGIQLDYTTNLNVVAHYDEFLNATSTFGMYPQTLVSDADIIAQLDLLEPEEDGYYHYGGNLYAKLVATPFAEGIKFSNGSEVVAGEAYYFKVELIKWTIIVTNGNEYRLVSDKVLDYEVFNDSTTTIIDGDDTIYPNNYANSSISEFISALYDKIFSATDKPNIVNETYSNDENEANPSIITGDALIYVSEDVQDYLVMPSYKSIDLLTSRESQVTDYAIARGVSFDVATYNGFYFYRSPAASGKLVTFHYGIMDADGTMLVTDACGVRLEVTIISGAGE